MLSCLKSTHAFKQKLSSGVEWTILISNYSTKGLVTVTCVLSSWKTERSSQAPCFKLFDQLLFRFFCKIFKYKSEMPMYDPLKSLLCGISRSLPRHLWCIPSLFSQDMWYFWH
jgi:hypothetical protein